MLSLKSARTQVLLIGLIGLSLAVASYALVSESRPERKSTFVPTAVQSPVPLTEQEALAIFQSLHDELISAYSSRDLSAIELFALPGSPTEELVRADIRRLLEDQIVPEPSFRTRNLKTLELAASKILIRHIVVSDGRFLSESGRDVTGERKPELQTIEWTLGRTGDDWLIFDSTITAARELKNR